MKIEVHVKAGSKKRQAAPTGENRYQVHVRERAVEGRANEAVREVLAEHFEVAKSRVLIVSGIKSKIKKVEILV